MKKLESLTEQQVKHLEVNKEKFIKHFLSFKKIDRISATKAIEFVYSLIGKPMPKVYEAGDPMTAQVIANKLTGTEGKFYTYGTYLTSRWASFYAFYETFVDFGIVTKENNPKYFQLREFLNSNIFMTIEFESAIIVVEHPLCVHTNSVGMHNTKEYAIEWRNGYGQHYINGRYIAPELFNKAVSDQFTFQDFVKIENEDEKGIIMTIIKENKGNEGLLNFLNAQLIDERELVHAGGYTETVKLFKTKEKYSFLQNSKGQSNQPYAWINMKCPSTETEYLIDTCPTFTDVVECAKWHRPKEVPQSLKYLWQSAN